MEEASGGRSDKLIGFYLISVNPGEEGEAVPPIGVYLTSANPGEKEGVDHGPH